jgi:hypothetical protein
MFDGCGVERVLPILREELSAAMQQMGAPQVSALTREIGDQGLSTKAAARNRPLLAGQVEYELGDLRSVDNSIRSQPNGCRHAEPKRLRRFEVDD